MKRGTIISSFERYEDADKTIKELNPYVDRKDISVLGNKDVLKVDAKIDKVDEATKEGAKMGAATGGIAGLLFGVSALTVPGFGPVVTFGTLGATLTTALTGGAVGGAAGALLGSLIDFGVPEEYAEMYVKNIQSGDILLAIEHAEEHHEDIISVLSQNEAKDVLTYKILNESEKLSDENQESGFYATI